MIVLVDTFNGRVLSRHRTVQAAENAADKISRKLKEKSPGAYLPMDIAVEDPQGRGIPLNSPNTFFGVGRLRPVHGGDR